MGPPLGQISGSATALHVQLFFKDRHALGEYEPLIDDSQDVTLLVASQNETHTILRFSRPYVTCDENDLDMMVSSCES